MKWRQNGQHGFTKYFNVTFQSTKKWLDLLVQQRKDRLLFLVFDCEDQMIGHLGVSSFDFEKNTCEIDNVIRGEISNQNDVMFSAAAVLIEWINSNIKPHDINITVLYDNISALLLYHRLGFVPYKLEGLQKVEKNQEIEWVHKQHGKIDKFIIKMSLKYKTDKLHEKRN
jgi:RimJ/RimL family protein N-acetyltransferase